jgi:hypothetical protein
MSVWVGEDMVTLRAIRGKAGWVFRKSVARAVHTTTLDNPSKMMREAKAVVRADWESGLL